MGLGQIPRPSSHIWASTCCTRHPNPAIGSRQVHSRNSGRRPRGSISSIEIQKATTVPSWQGQVGYPANWHQPSDWFVSHWLKRHTNTKRDAHGEHVGDSCSTSMVEEKGLLQGHDPSFANWSTIWYQYSSRRSSSRGTPSCRGAKSTIRTSSSGRTGSTRRRSCTGRTGSAIRRRGTAGCSIRITQMFLIVPAMGFQPNSSISCFCPWTYIHIELPLVCFPSATIEYHVLTCLEGPLPYVLRWRHIEVHLRSRSVQ